MKLIYNEKMMINVLIATSIMMFVSLFFGSKTAALGMTLWILNIAWIMYLLVRGRTSHMSEYHEKQIQEAKEKGQYGKYAIYSIALPLCVVGMLFVILNLLVLFWM